MSGGLGCSIGRQSAVAIMLDFFGHQIVAHVTEDLGDAPQVQYLPSALWVGVPNRKRMD